MEGNGCYALGIIPPWLEKTLNFVSLEYQEMPITPIFLEIFLNLVMKDLP